MYYSICSLIEKNSVQQLKEAILDTQVEITGALLDSYVAGHWAQENFALNDDSLRVGKVIDHQFAYGFVVDGVLNDETFTKCLRQKLNRMETEITSIIQSQAKTMEVSQFFCLLTTSHIMVHLSSRHSTEAEPCIIQICSLHYLSLDQKAMCFISELSDQESACYIAS